MGSSRLAVAAASAVLLVALGGLGWWAVRAAASAVPQVSQVPEVAAQTPEPVESGPELGPAAPEVEAAPEVAAEPPVERLHAWLTPGVFYAPSLPRPPARPRAGPADRGAASARSSWPVVVATAAREGDCRSALDATHQAVSRSEAFASLFETSWGCFSRKHGDILERARIADPGGLFDQRDHFEGPAMGAWSWTGEPTGGLELRIQRFEQDGPSGGFRDALTGQLGAGKVADDLAMDLMLETTAALAFSTLEGRSPAEDEILARRIKWAGTLLHGEGGALIRTHRTEVHAEAEAVLTAIVTPPEGMALPPVVEQAWREAQGVEPEPPEPVRVRRKPVKVEPKAEPEKAPDGRIRIHRYND